MKKGTSSFLKLEWIHGASSFNIKGMRDGTDTFLKGTLTTLYKYLYIYYIYTHTYVDWTDNSQVLLLISAVALYLIRIFNYTISCDF